MTTGEINLAYIKYVLPYVMSTDNDIDAGSTNIVYSAKTCCWIAY